MVKQLLKAARDAGIRVEIDDRSEKIGYKIRDAEVKKIPYMAIIGEKELADRFCFNSSSRKRRSGFDARLRSSSVSLRARMFLV